MKYSRLFAAALAICVVASTVSVLSAADTSSGGDFTLVPQGFSIDHFAPQMRWADGAAPTADTWKPVAQAGLDQALNSAPGLKMEQVAAPPQRLNYADLPFLCPNPDGKSWDIIVTYRKNYLSEGQIYVQDLGTGEHKMYAWGRKKENLAEGEELLFSGLSDFHMKPSYYTNGKLVFVIPIKRKGEMFLVYDPATNSFIRKDIPFDGGSQRIGIVLGNDGKFYGHRLCSSRSAFQYFIYDPTTGETTLSRQVGKRQKHPFEHYRSSSKAGNWLYSKFGHAPWLLSAYNFKTGEFKILGRTTEIKGDHKTIILRNIDSGVYGSIQSPEFVEGQGPFEGEAAKCFDFWLHDGKIYPRTNSTPPWSDKPINMKGKRDRLAGQMERRCRQGQKWPEGFWRTVSEPPIFKQWSTGIATGEGDVNLSYRLPGDATDQGAPWRSIKYQVRLYDGIIRYMIEMNNDSIFGIDEKYGQKVMYDLKNRRVKRYQLSLETYSVGIHGDSVYVAGYPLMYTHRFPVMDMEGKNSISLGNLGKANDTHAPFAGVASGADGKMYTAGSTLGRRRDGGGMSWYDPATGKKGYVDGIADQRIFWMTAANGGKHIILSTKGTNKNPEIKLVGYDVLKGKIIYKLPSPTGNHAGPVVEAFPGLIMGYGPKTTADGKTIGCLFGMDAATGKALWTKDVPAPPATGFHDVRRHKYGFRRGPDGFIWAIIGNTLVRINPQTVEVIPVGKLKGAGQIAFAQNSVFVAGGALSRIANLRVETVKSEN